jgi:hypothetical protein
MRSLNFSVDLALPAAIWAWGRLKPLTEMSTRNFPGGGGGVNDGLSVRLITLPPSISRVNRNYGSFNVSEPFGTSWTVYLFTHFSLQDPAPVSPYCTRSLSSSPTFPCILVKYFDKSVFLQFFPYLEPIRLICSYFV